MLGTGIKKSSLYVHKLKFIHITISQKAVQRGLLRLHSSFTFVFLFASVTRNGRRAACCSFFLQKYYEHKVAAVPEGPGQTTERHEKRVS